MSSSNTQQDQAPSKTFRAGTIEAAIWVNEVDQDGRSITRHSIRFQKRYQEKSSGEWKTSNYYFPSDLPDLQLVAREAFRFARLRESGSNSDGQPD